MIHVRPAAKHDLDNNNFDCVLKMNHYVL